MRRLRSIPEIDHAQRKAEFGRFLAAWAQDCFRLGRSGLLQPGDRTASRASLGPGPASGLLERPADDLSMIEWRPGVREAARA